MHILDIDLDFFQDGIIHSILDRESKNKNVSLWSLDGIVNYLSEQLNINKNDCVVFLNEHVEVFFYLSSFLKKYNINEKITYTHIDAHSDLGYHDLTIDNNNIKSNNYLFYLINLFNIDSLEMVYAKYSVLDIPGSLLGNYHFLHDKRIEIIKNRKIEIKLNKKSIKLTIFSEREYKTTYKYDTVFISHSPNYTASNSFELFNSLKNIYKKKC